MSIDRTSGLDKELAVIVEALPSAEKDAVGKPVTKNEATGFVNRLQRLKNMILASV
jgi:hypothetical protein